MSDTNRENDPMDEFLSTLGIGMGQRAFWRMIALDCFS